MNNEELLNKGVAEVGEDEVEDESGADQSPSVGFTYEDNGMFKGPFGRTADLPDMQLERALNQTTISEKPVPENESFAIARPGLAELLQPNPLQQNFDTHVTLAVKLKLEVARNELNRQLSELSPEAHNALQRISDWKERITNYQKKLQQENLDDETRKNIKLKLGDAQKQLGKEQEMLTPKDEAKVKAVLLTQERIKEYKDRLYESSSLQIVEKPSGRALNHSDKANPVQERPETVETREHRMLQAENEQFNQIWTSLSAEDRTTIGTLAELRRGLIIYRIRTKDQFLPDDERAAAQATKANMEMWQNRVLNGLAPEQEEKFNRVLNMQERIAAHLQLLNSGEPLRNK